MAVTCTPSALLSAATCFECLTPKEAEMVRTYLLAVVAGGSTDPKLLLAQAKCMSCLTSKEQEWIQTFLICKIQGG